LNATVNNEMKILMGKVNVNKEELFILGQNGSKSLQRSKSEKNLYLNNKLKGTYNWGGLGHPGIWLINCLTPFSHHDVIFLFP
jgi:hypothetical protein